MLDEERGETEEEDNCDKSSEKGLMSLLVLEVEGDRLTIEIKGSYHLCERVRVERVGKMLLNFLYFLALWHLV